MDWTKKIVCILILIAFLVPIGSVGAEVTWDESITDARDDVEKNYTEEVTGYPGVDILEVSMSDEGDYVNLTLVLAGEQNWTATYSINLKVDGETGWSFTRMIFFMATNPAGDFLDVEANVSEDGTEFYWVVPKSELNATESVELDYAESGYFDLDTFDSYTDRADPGDGPVPPVPGPEGPDIEFKSVSIVMDFTEVTRLRMTVEMVIDGEDTPDIRLGLDQNSDGTVSASEVSDFLDRMDDSTDDEETNMTLDGLNATSEDRTGSLEGVEGPTDSTEDIKLIFVITTNFPEPEDKDTHTYAWPTDDDEVFIGGDEPWENEADYEMRIVCPDGWKFDTTGWPSALKDLLNTEETELSMDDTQIRTQYNDTVGDLNALVIKKEDSGDDGNGDDESPGFGLLVALLAVGASAAILGRRRDG